MCPPHLKLNFFFFFKGFSDQNSNWCFHNDKWPFTKTLRSVVSRKVRSARSFPITDTSLEASLLTGEPHSLLKMLNIESSWQASARGFIVSQTLRPSSFLWRRCNQNILGTSKVNRNPFSGEGQPLVCSVFEYPHRGGGNGSGKIPGFNCRLQNKM